MMNLFRADVRERWSSRSMVVRRWLIREIFDPEQPVCELETDGVMKPLFCRDPILYTNRPPREPDFGMIRRFYVVEGKEVDLSGQLFEFEGTTRVGDSPDARGGPPIHASGRITLARRDRYPQIFLNYRRDDADAYAGRLHEVLAQKFGEEEIFMAEFSIRPGEVWHWTIQQAVVHARILVALIGRHWLTLQNGQKRRIDSPDDVVRREIVGAMDRGTLIVPVLLPEAIIPRADDFGRNDELSNLPKFQFHRLAGARYWKADVQDLIDTISRHLEDPNTLGA